MSVDLCALSMLSIIIIIIVALMFGESVVDAVQSDEVEKKVTCRFDWHQTPSTVTISVYAKIADPTKTTVETNKVTANLNIVFDAGNSCFNKSFVLHGVRVWLIPDSDQR